jgi:hypothetical protein
MITLFYNPVLNQFPVPQLINFLLELSLAFFLSYSFTPNKKLWQKRKIKVAF